MGRTWRTNKPRSRVPNLGGARLQPEGIIGFLCTMDYAPLLLYIRTCPIGPVLCTFLHTHFREHLFHALKG
jgi:hypothetical protein